MKTNNGTNGTDCWFVVKDKVYNGTPFLADHPGGGLDPHTDCTTSSRRRGVEAARGLLSRRARREWRRGGDGSIAPPTTIDISDKPGMNGGAPITLDPSKYVELPLIKKDCISHDTRLFRFALPSPQHMLGLPVGQHLFLRADIAGKKVMRAYTPLDSGAGYVDFVIKVYFANVHPRFPEGGKLTQHLERMNIGDKIAVKGPLGEYIFHPANPPSFTHTPSGNKFGFDTIGFIAGGSGITPVLQTARALLEDTTVKGIKISILYANRTDADILCHDTLKQIDELPNVHVWYTLDQPPDNWSYSSGFIDEAMVRQHLPGRLALDIHLLLRPAADDQLRVQAQPRKVGHDASMIHCF